MIETTKTKKITLCAVMMALSAVLSIVPLYQAPYGGTVTLGSMVPLVLVCVMIEDMRWGVLTCFAYSLLQMMLGFSAPPTGTFAYFVAVVLLDYVAAFTVLFTVNPVSKIFNNKYFGIVSGTVVACILRFICHFISGILLWGVYAPEDTPVWLYSILYNGGYMLPETVITAVIATSIYAAVSRQKK